MQVWRRQQFAGCFIVVFTVLLVFVNVVKIYEFLIVKYDEMPWLYRVGQKKLRQIFLAITLVNMDRF